jgi:hypothetical protein
MRLSTSVLACLAMLGSPALAVAQSTVSHPRIGLLAWDTCEMPDLIAGLKDLSRFQRGGQRMLPVIPSCGLVQDVDHGGQIPGCRERRAAA